MQGCVHGWESMGRLLRPGMWAKITHIELRIEHRAPRLLPARCDADARQCLDFQALGRRRGHDDPCVDGGSAMYGIRIVCRALQESTRPNRHPGYGKPAPENGTYLLQCGVRRTWAVDFAGRGEFTAPTSRDPLAKSPSAPSDLTARKSKFIWRIEYLFWHSFWNSDLYTRTRALDKALAMSHSRAEDLHRD